MVYFVLGVLIGFLSAFNLMKKFCRKQPQFINKTVLVTGASSGIGEFVCYEMSRLGANVVLCSRREEELKRVQNRLAFPEKSSIFVLDMKDPDKVFRETQSLLKSFEERTGFKKLDILIMNAGIAQRQQFEHSSLQVFDEIMRVNFNSCVTMTRAVLPVFQEQKSGQIVATSSVFGLHAAPKRSAYSASKHALNGFLNSLRPQVAQYNIAITLICPGAVATNITYTALMGDGSKYGKQGLAHGISSQNCAKEFVDAVYRKELRRTVGKCSEKFRVFYSRLSSNVEARGARQLYKFL